MIAGHGLSETGSEQAVSLVQYVILVLFLPSMVCYIQFRSGKSNITVVLFLSRELANQAIATHKPSLKIIIKTSYVMVTIFRE